MRTTLDIALQSGNEMTTEHYNNCVKQERDFWKAKAEMLHDQLERIFEHANARNDGAVRIMRRGVEVTLYIRAPASTMEGEGK